MKSTMKISYVFITRENCTTKYYFVKSHDLRYAIISQYILVFYLATLPANVFVDKPCWKVYRLLLSVLRNVYARATFQQLDL